MSGSEGMDIRQRQPSNLRLLLVQRRIYRRAKRWSALRLIGNGLIPIIAAVLFGIDSRFPTPIVAVVGIWILLDQGLLRRRERAWAMQGAAAQEDFDTRVFDIPSNLDLVKPFRRELLGDFAGDEDTMTRAAEEGLVGWYEVIERLPHGPAVAICQRSNAAYNARLLSRHGWMLAGLAGIWIAATAAAALISRTSALGLLLDVAVPALPALSYACDSLTAHFGTAARSLRLASDIDQTVQIWPNSPLTTSDLRGFQDRIYLLRRGCPLVPERLYRRLRSANELAMRLAAVDLSGVVLSHTTKNDDKPVSRTTRILFLAANPDDTGRLALDREYREIDAALRSAGLRDHVELASAWAVHVRDLQSTLLRYQPVVVHFAGHGSQSRGIRLAENYETTVTGDAIARLIKAIGKGVRLVVLNACWSAEQAEAIASEVDCVIGMRVAVSDQAAIEFAQSLYEALGYGHVIQDAFDAATARLDSLNLTGGPPPGHHSKDTATPVMVVRRGIDPTRMQLIG